MCGLAGFCDFTKRSSIDALVSMTNVLHHRGPDDSGYKLTETAEALIGLGHRRLSIIDLSGLAHQPMDFQNLTIVHNGEIYNFKEIRTELERYGYAFKSNSDTEVILKAFHKWGVEAVHKFIGMFAFAIFDKVENKLFIFRDRPGVKPVYYYWKNGLFLFASELKAFHQHFAFQKELDIDSSALYLKYGYIPVPHCIFRHAYKVKPGHFLIVNLERREVEEYKYWDVISHYNKPKLNISEQEAAEEIEIILKSAFEYRLVSDVPVGLFLSGGYDSSVVAALLQTDRTEKLKTISIGWHEKGFNEAMHARKVAEYLGTDHTEYYCRAKEAGEIIPKLPEIYDEPFGDSSAIPTVLLSKLARQQVSVALSADGGDETFAGYAKYTINLHIDKKIAVLPYRVRQALKPFLGIVTHLPYFKHVSNIHGKVQTVKRFFAKKDFYDQILRYRIEPKGLTGVFDSDLANSFQEKETFFDYFARINSFNDALNRMLCIDYKTYMTDDLLAKVDRAAMSVSLESREPFLDHRIIEYVSRLPSNLKYRDGQRKYIFRTIVHKHLPKEIMDRPKMGFSIPIDDWFRGELKEHFVEYLSQGRLVREDIFNAAEVGKLRDNYFNGKAKGQKLWFLLMFEMWYEKWMGS